MYSLNKSNFGMSSTLTGKYNEKLFSRGTGIKEKNIELAGEITRDKEVRKLLSQCKVINAETR